MKRLLNNWNLKLISLGLAILLWLHVRSEVNPLETAEIDVPLKLSLPVGWSFKSASKIPAHATVTLSGPHLSLRSIKGGALSNPLNPLAPIAATTAGGAQVKLSAAEMKPRKGEQQIALNAQSEVNDVEILGVKPASVSVTLVPNAKQ